jgi:hypothetical protein
MARDLPQRDKRGNVRSLTSVIDTGALARQVVRSSAALETLDLRSNPLSIAGVRALEGAAAAAARLGASSSAAQKLLCWLAATRCKQMAGPKMVACVAANAGARLCIAAPACMHRAPVAPVLYSIQLSRAAAGSRDHQAAEPQVRCSGEQARSSLVSAASRSHATHPHGAGRGRGHDSVRDLCSAGGHCPARSSRRFRLGGTTSAPGLRIGVAARMRAAWLGRKRPCFHRTRSLADGLSHIWG